MKIQILSPENIEFKEKDIQHAFELELSKLDDGIEFIQSEVMIGAGRIDTLGFDSINSRPVIIEYKGKGGFDKDALVQLMDYLSWFLRDENRLVMLEKLIRQQKTEIEDFDRSPLLICVVNSISDRLRNAIFAIKTDVKIFSYIVARDTADNIIIVPRLELDNSDIEPSIKSPISINELLEKDPHLHETFTLLRQALEVNGAKCYTTSRSLRFRKERVFAKVNFRKKYILLQLRVGAGEINDSDFKYWRKGESAWGYTFIYPLKELPSKLLDWINKAHIYDEKQTEEEDE